MVSRSDQGKIKERHHTVHAFPQERRVGELVGLVPAQLYGSNRDERGLVITFFFVHKKRVVALAFWVRKALMPERFMI